jgi:hypothetical protein
MNSVVSLVFLLALSGHQLSEASNVDLKNANGKTPISLVVSMLRNLQDKLEKDYKHEKDLFETATCWNRKVIAMKQTANDDARSRIGELETYIKDISSGKIEFTTERVDLQKEKKDLEQDIREAEAMAAKQKKEFIAADKEMEKAIKALNKAITVLGDATKDHKTGVFLDTDSDESQGMGFAARAAEHSQLVESAEISSKFLEKTDSTFLRRLLTGDVPLDTPERASWKTLNRKANFKSKYKARSFKIQATLQEVEDTFQKDRAAAARKFEEQQAENKKMMQTLHERLEATVDALNSMEKETGQREKVKQESQDEIDNLKEQIQIDSKFIAQTQEYMILQKQEWDDRSVLRQGELSTMNQAIAILTDDANRDMFSKSYKSQTGEGLDFMQVEMSSGSQQREAIKALHEAARASRDSRLYAIANLIDPSHKEQVRGRFGQVVTAIMEMIKTLEEEAESDLQKKEKCESDRSTNAFSAITLSRQVDGLTDDVNRLRFEIKNLNAEIAEKQEMQANVEQELAQATSMRKEENADFLQSKSDDEQAIAITKQALNVITDFYEKNKLALLQKSKEDPTITELDGMKKGEAPPPPPSTWEAPYSGATEETSSITTTLEIIIGDMQKDAQKAQKEEDEAQKSFDEQSADLNNQRQDLMSAIAELQGTLGKAEDDQAQAKLDRKTTKQDLDAQLKEIASVEPGCDFLTLNFEVRKTNRLAEIGALEKAKFLLVGAGEQKKCEDVVCAPCGQGTKKVDDGSCCGKCVAQPVNLIAGSTSNHKDLLSRFFTGSGAFLQK